jgi:hypothetical protein
MNTQHAASVTKLNSKAKAVRRKEAIEQLWKLSDWKQNRFTLPWQQWIGFLSSYRFETAVTNYSRVIARTAREMIPNGKMREIFSERLKQLASLQVAHEGVCSTRF